MCVCGACFCVKENVWVSASECVCVWQPKQVYHTVDFNAWKYPLGTWSVVCTLPSAPPPSFHHPFFFSTSPFFLPLMSFWLTFWRSLLDVFAGAGRLDKWNLWELIIFFLCDFKRRRRDAQDKLKDSNISLVNFEGPHRRNQMKCLLSLSPFDEEDIEAHRELITRLRSSAIE